MINLEQFFYDALVRSIPGKREQPSFYWVPFFSEQDITRDFKCDFE